MREKLLTISLVLATTLLAILVGEVGLRSYFKQHVNLYPRYHSVVQYDKYKIRRFLPNSKFVHTSVDGQWQFRINEKGFRSDVNYAYKKPENTGRVLVVGDSHAAGFEVHQHEMFSSVLENRLKGSGKRWEVINAAVSGFGTGEQLVYLEHEGLKYSPDYVVLSFYANDFSDNLKSALFAVEDGELQESSFQHTPGSKAQRIINESRVLQWLGQYSYIYSLTFNFAYNFAKDMLLSEARKDAETEFAIPVSDATDYEIDLTKALVQRLYATTKNAGAKLLIVDVPDTPRKGEKILRSSIPDNIVPFMKGNSDVLLLSDEMFDDFAADISVLNVPHGQKHISAVAHNRIAEMLSSAILAGESK